jgi:small-conductance mechanosensitive channel
LIRSDYSGFPFISQYEKVEKSSVCKGECIMPTFSTQINWISLLTPVIKSFVIIAVAFTIHSLAKRLIRRLIRRTARAAEKRNSRVQTLETLLVSTSFYFISFIAGISVLDSFQVRISAILTSASIAMLIFGFGAKDLVADIVTGFFMLLEDQVQVGEHVTIQNFSGRVESVGMRVIRIRADNGDLHFVPNREVKSLTNHSRGPMEARVDLPLPADTDLERALSVLNKECRRLGREIPTIVKGPEVLGVESLSADSILIRIRAWAENGQQSQVERTLRRELIKVKELGEDPGIRSYAETN